MNWRQALDALRGGRIDRWDRLEADRAARFDAELAQLLNEEAAKDAAREHRHPSGYGGAPVERDRPRHDPGAPPTSSSS